MGVQNLWKLLAPCGHRVSIETLSTRRLAIDVSIWLTQFIKAMRDKETGEMVANAHLLGMMRRICKLLFHHIKPIFVFDGPAPMLKKRTLAQRQRVRSQATANFKRAAERLLLNQLRLKSLEKAKALEVVKKSKEFAKEQEKEKGNGQDGKEKKKWTPTKGKRKRAEKDEENEVPEVVAHVESHEVVDVDTADEEVKVVDDVAGIVDTTRRKATTPFVDPALLDFDIGDYDVSGIYDNEDVERSKGEQKKEEGSSNGKDGEYELLGLEESADAELSRNPIRSSSRKTTSSFSTTILSTSSSSASSIPLDPDRLSGLIDDEEEDEIEADLLNDGDVYIPGGEQLDAETLARLPISLCTEIIQQHRQNQIDSSRDLLNTHGPNSFSEMQLESFLSASKLKQRVNKIRSDLQTSFSIGGVPALRIASEADRHFVLYNRNDKKNNAPDVIELDQDTDDFENIQSSSSPSSSTSSSAPLFLAPSSSSYSAVDMENKYADQGQDVSGDDSMEMGGFMREDQADVDMMMMGGFMVEGDDLDQNEAEHSSHGGFLPEEQDDVSLGGGFLPQEAEAESDNSGSQQRLDANPSPPDEKQAPEKPKVQGWKCSRCSHYNKGRRARALRCGSCNTRRPRPRLTELFTSSTLSSLASALIPSMHVDSHTNEIESHNDKEANSSREGDDLVEKQEIDAWSSNIKTPSTSPQPSDSSSFSSSPIPIVTEEQKRARSKMRVDDAVMRVEESEGIGSGLRPESVHHSSSSTSALSSDTTTFSRVLASSRVLDQLTSRAPTGRWRCDACGHSNVAKHTSCKKCHAPSSWTCKHCSQLNRSSSSSCIFCGLHSSSLPVAMPLPLASSFSPPAASSTSSFVPPTGTAISSSASSSATAAFPLPFSASSSSGLPMSATRQTALPKASTSTSVEVSFSADAIDDFGEEGEEDELFPSTMFQTQSAINRIPMSSNETIDLTEDDDEVMVLPSAPGSLSLPSATSSFTRPVSLASGSIASSVHCSSVSDLSISSSLPSSALSVPAASSASSLSASSLPSPPSISSLLSSSPPSASSSVALTPSWLEVEPSGTSSSSSSSFPRVMSRPRSSTVLLSHAQQRGDPQALWALQQQIEAKQDNDNEMERENVSEPSLTEEKEILESDIDRSIQQEMKTAHDNQAIGSTLMHEENSGSSSSASSRALPFEIDDEDFEEDQEALQQALRLSLAPTSSSSSSPSASSSAADQSSGYEAKRDVDSDLSFTPYVPGAISAEGQESAEKIFEENRQLRQEKARQIRGEVTVTEEMLLDCKDLLRLFGIPYIESPAEAEAQCAVLEQLGLVDGVVTDDSDVFLFGASTVYRNIFDQKKYVEKYHAAEIENVLGLDRRKLIHMAMLLGSDYTSGVKGVGPVNAMEVVNAFPGEDGLAQFKQWVYSASVEEKPKRPDFPEDASTEEQERVMQEYRTAMFKYKHRNIRRSWEMSAHFPEQAVVQAYWKPIADDSREKLQWGTCDVARLRDWLARKLEFSGERLQDIDKLLAPVIEAMKVTHPQARLDSFFAPDDTFAQLKSKRIKLAVSGLKNKLAAMEEIEGSQRAKRKKGKKKKKKQSDDDTDESEPEPQHGDEQEEDEEVAEAKDEEKDEEKAKGKVKGKTEARTKGKAKGKAKEVAKGKAESQTEESRGNAQENEEKRNGDNSAVPKEAKPAKKRRRRAI